MIFSWFQKVVSSSHAMFGIRMKSISLSPIPGELRLSVSLSLHYTREASGVLDALNYPRFPCNNEPGAHTKRTRGRGLESTVRARKKSTPHDQSTFHADVVCDDRSNTGMVGWSSC